MYLLRVYTDLLHCVSTTLLLIRCKSRIVQSVVVPLFFWMVSNIPPTYGFKLDNNFTFETYEYRFTFLSQKNITLLRFFKAL